MSLENTLNLIKESRQSERQATKFAFKRNISNLVGLNRNKVRNGVAVNTGSGFISNLGKTTKSIYNLGKVYGKQGIENVSNALNRSSNNSVDQQHSINQKQRIIKKMNIRVGASAKDLQEKQKLYNTMSKSKDQLSQNLSQNYKETEVDPAQSRRDNRISKLNQMKTN